MNKAEWERILEGFKVERRDDGFSWIADRWAVVSTKQARVEAIVLVLAELESTTLLLSG
jgi:hypothetical protein